MKLYINYDIIFMMKDKYITVKIIILIVLGIYLLSGTVFEMVYISDLMKPLPWMWLKVLLFILDLIFCLGFDLFVLYKVYKFIFNEKFY